MCTINGHAGSTLIFLFFCEFFLGSGCCHNVHILHDWVVFYLSIYYFILYQAKSDTYEKLVKDMVMDQRTIRQDKNPRGNSAGGKRTT
jgi:hypothetical protein